MEIRTIDAKTLDDFVLSSQKYQFMQTSAWAEVARSRGQKAHQLGFYEDNTLKATALLLEKKIGPFASFYCPRGMRLQRPRASYFRSETDEGIHP